MCVAGQWFESSKCSSYFIFCTKAFWVESKKWNISIKHMAHFGGTFSATFIISKVCWGVCVCVVVWWALCVCVLCDGARRRVCALCDLMCEWHNTQWPHPSFNGRLQNSIQGDCKILSASYSRVSHPYSFFLTPVLPFKPFYLCSPYLGAKWPP